MGAFLLSTGDARCTSVHSRGGRPPPAPCHRPHHPAMMIELPDVVTVAGYGYDALRPEIRRGEIERFRPGAYMHPAAQDEPLWKRRHRAMLARCVAVADKLTTPFAFTDVTAAALRGWSVPLPDHVIHIVQTVNPGTGCAADVIRHVCSSLDAQDVEWINGLPVVGEEQTVLACARRLQPDDAFVVVNSAFGKLAGMSKFRRAESEVAQAELRGRLQTRLAELGPVRGVRRAREVIALADGFAEWPGESRMRWIALAAGLPLPTCQHELWVDGQRYFADATWHGEGPDGPWLAIAEFDGDIKYGGARGSRAVVEEKIREDAIRRRHRARFARLDTSTVNQPARALARMLDAFPDGCVPPLQPRSLLQIRPTPARRNR